jgi:hypothetical protein
MEDLRAEPAIPRDCSGSYIVAPPPTPHIENCIAYDGGGVGYNDRVAGGRPQHKGGASHQRLQEGGGFVESSLLHFHLLALLLDAHLQLLHLAVVRGQLGGLLLLRAVGVGGQGAF